MALQYFYIFLFISIISSGAYEFGQRLFTLTASQHAFSRTPWLDMPLDTMPRFGVSEKVIFHAAIPKYHRNSTDYRIDTTHDFKVSFAFANFEHMVEWITVFDSEKRKTLRKLLLTFTRDEFDIVRVDYQLIYGPRIAKIDPSHPTLHGFEIQYAWEDAPIEDKTWGIQVMCMSSLGFFFLLFFAVLLNVKDDEMNNSSSDKPSESKATKRR